MEFRPIVSALMRNKTGAVLVVLQIAITMAVIVNALFIINERVEKMNRDSGMDIENMIAFQSWGFRDDYNHEIHTRENIDFINSIPGVIAVTPSASLPLSNGGSANDFRATPDRFDADGNQQPHVNANIYYLSEQGLDALGVGLASGRDFRAEEINFMDRRGGIMPPAVIMTRDFAKKAFGTEDALGKTLYDFFGEPAEVVGLIEHMQGAWVNWDELTNIVILPGIQPGPFLRYIVRTEPGRRDEVIAVMEEQLPNLNRSRMIRRIEPYTDIVERSYRADHSMTVLLITTVILLVSITSLGIVGLASFAVRQRTKQIGTRRAIGATRFHIMRYFMVENWIVTTVGIGFGVVFAIAFNMWLVDTYALTKLDWIYIPFGVVALWVLGQVAVLMPAVRASGIAPAIATRTV